MSPIIDKLDESLRLDCSSWLICDVIWPHLNSPLSALQENRSLATKSIATANFRCDIIKNYYELSGCGDRTLIFPRLFLVAINYHFVAVEAAYCNDLHRSWNTIAFLRQRRSVA